ncbi:S24 family peptidase [Thioclava litoralis]|uniref:S24 family peptidase n=1 Tax=Thioclava litoralis TaxID=3076557 RepID=A0ABZ1E1A7_9RHOB|nr:S24 family peptidase [Thioclava sp. FTW29]
MPVIPCSNEPIQLQPHSVPLAEPLVSAGFPSPAGDDIEDEIDPIAWVVRRPSSTFWWRVEGECLWDVGIRDGDLIAVDRAAKCRPGRVVLAIVEDAIVAKIIQRRKDGSVYLTTANARQSYQDIELTENSQIWGVIAGVVRKLPVD